MTHTHTHTHVVAIVDILIRIQTHKHNMNIHTHIYRVHIERRGDTLTQWPRDRRHRKHTPIYDYSLNENKSIKKK